ncbi:type IV secretory system conjugative DNA transfer family protein [Parasphingorhabdus halotolerans]|uniref:ATP-binding protein n=1 Tax=Parasphingorhabdus halotolerans TaxID=2725558 RepID=A0A6H2DPH6_9SPHN|nr:TraM recognition domain-containing protein [Parasphingorhabdus halotolerans]QJB69865.1 ATP-binding protein [Parasphingorhabdus halotolerans]
MQNSVTIIGNAFHRTTPRRFGIQQADRLHHFFAMGQTGTGKSTLIEQMALQDAEAGRGFCIIDPHGDMAESLAGKIKQSHIHWRVADAASPYGYNPLTPASAKHRPLIASGLIETLKKQWSDSWGARMEHLLRYSILALLELPQADMRDITRMYIDKDFRRTVVPRITDPQVRAFWTEELPKMNYMTSIDGVAPIANKLGAFLAHPIMRTALCQPKEPLRFRKIMDEGRILIINLAKGQLGSDNANVLGGLIVSSIMNAAFSRHDTPLEKRRPFFLYVDEFHNFTTESFAEMLSEMRKYRISINLFCQHSSQMEKPVFEAVLGNCGTVLSFRLGAHDAPLMGRQLGDLPPYALVSLPNYRGYCQLMIGGHKTPAFSIQTWRPDLP